MMTLFNMYGQTTVSLADMWLFPQEFNRMMQRGAARCWNIAASERMMGYTGTWVVYRELAEELKALPGWVHQEISRGNAAGSLLSSSDVGV
jgi:hypothetical protein